MADNRQFTDHNEIGGVNVYLEDKKLAESPEQNTVATTDYVLLKDTDGVPHKISKANMMSVVKDALADLLKNNDLGTSVTNVPALNASAFGSATVANLASVLGVKRTSQSLVANAEAVIETSAQGCFIIASDSKTGLTETCCYYYYTMGSPVELTYFTVYRKTNGGSIYIKNKTEVERVCDVASIVTKI